MYLLFISKNGPFLKKKKQKCQKGIQKNLKFIQKVPFDNVMKTSIKDHCLEIMNKLMETNYFNIFLEPVNPIRDNCPDYFDVIARPMDFTTCKTKLQEGKYQSIIEWKADIELISSNAIFYYGTESINGIIALELRDVFNKYTKNLTESPLFDWLVELNQISEEFSQDVRPISFNAKHMPSDLSLDIQNDDKPITREELVQMAQEISSMTNEAHIQRLFECLKSNNPHLVGDKKGITVDICKLSKSTLLSLQNELLQIQNETV